MKNGSGNSFSGWEKVFINPVFYIMSDIFMHPPNLLLGFYHLEYNDLHFGMTSYVFKDVYHLLTDYDKKLENVINTINTTNKNGQLMK